MKRHNFLVMYEKLWKVQDWEESPVEILHRNEHDLIRLMRLILVLAVYQRLINIFRVIFL